MRPRRRRNGQIWVTAAAAVVVLIASITVAVLGGGTSSGFHPTAGNPSGDAEQLTNAFLKDWSAGNLNAAADLTDSPAAAMKALAQYRSDMHLQKLTGSAQSATTARAPKGSSAAGTVTYSVNSTVSSGPLGSGRKAVSGAWSSHPTLTAYQQAGGSNWLIQWKPSVLAPNLTAGQHLGVATVAPMVISVTDSTGNPLSSYGDPGLAHIGTELQSLGSPDQGAPGLNVQIENAKGKMVTGTQPGVVVSPQEVGSLKTTINPTAEKAAVSAVHSSPQSSMVVIQPSSGRILAIASNDGENDTALTTRLAPGSDFKIVTSTALFNHNIVTPGTGVSCPSTILGIGNDQGETEPAGTPFSTDFAASCNNAFTQWYPKLSASSGKDLLASTGEKYYGLNRNWDIGIGNEAAQYFSMPSNGGNGEIAEEAFGQGQLQGDPLAMASVTSTVENGVFKQPILVPGTKQITGTPLPQNTKNELWECMRQVIVNPQGTANGVGFGPNVYGKTGTASVGGQSEPDAWFVAFDSSKDIAAATLVVNGGYGATAAAPEVKTVFNAFGG